MNPGRVCLRLFAIVVLLVPSTLRSEDWPMWRYDAGRTAVSPQVLPAELHLRWVRQYPPLKAAFRNTRLQFDKSYEPIVLGQTLFVASSHNDTVTALDTGTGVEKWRFHAGGPVRCAPAAWDGKVYFGSDDGHLYCLGADDGSLVWKYRAVPSQRQILGNGRLISVWPVRGGPVLQDGKVYFAAGVWSFEGTFVYALDARTGEVIWVNDRTGYLYGQHPHGAEAFGGLSPQGYLLVNDNDLVVPGSAAVPATFDLHTGKLKSFQLPRPGRLPGAWFASVLKKMTEEGPGKTIVFDSDLGTDQHEDKVNPGPGLPKIGSKVEIGGTELLFQDRVDGVEGTITSVLAADGKLFVVTREGSISCLGAKTEQVRRYPMRREVTERFADQWTSQASEILRLTNARRGYAVVLGLGSGRLIEELARQSELQLIGIDPDPAKVLALRSRFDQAGLYGTRIALQTEDASGLPRYLANLMVSEDPAAAGLVVTSGFLQRIFSPLRPYGGVACWPVPDEQTASFEVAVAKASLKGVQTRRTNGFTLLVRSGALPGAVNYTGNWSSPDPLVTAPLGVLWFDDALGHFKRSPQPKFVDGVMISEPKDWRAPPVRPYRLLPQAFSDVYTGRILADDETAAIRKAVPPTDPAEKQPSQYRPPGFSGDPYSPMKPEVGTRISPLTGKIEARDFVKSYGCDGGIDYGYLFTMRSGTAAFYDKRVESGTVNISGPRSGCSNSVIPANGVLNVPYFYEGCTCSYPLPTGLVMVNMPPQFEQWSAWGEGSTGLVQRVGINLGAPGDRITEDGTLWLDYPIVGGPSPQFDISIDPPAPDFFYHHSLWIEGGKGWPWICASGARGLASLTLSGLKAGAYTVRLYFAETDRLGIGARIFSVALQEKTVLPEFDIAAEAGGPMRGLVKEFKGVRVEGALKVAFSPQRGAPLLSGLELIAQGLPAAKVSTWEREPIKLFSGRQ